MPGVSGVTENDNLISSVASYIYKETEIEQKNTEECGVEPTNNVEIVSDYEAASDVETVEDVKGDENPVEEDEISGVDVITNVETASDVETVDDVKDDEKPVEDDEISGVDVITKVEAASDVETVEDVKGDENPVEEDEIVSAADDVERSSVESVISTEYLEESKGAEDDFDCGSNADGSEIVIENSGDENLLKSGEQTEQNAVEKPDGDIQKQADSSIKQCFTNIETLLAKLYEKVFDKNHDFKPTCLQVVNDLLSFIAHKSAEIGAFGKFRAVFNTDETLLIGTSRGDSYIPYIIKLTAVIDKNNKTDFTKVVTKEITKILLGLLSGKNDSAQTVTGAMSGIYSYVLSMGVKLM